MPELPEIEVLSQELSPRLVGRVLRRAVAYRAGLRDPFPQELFHLRNAVVRSVARRSKYLLLDFDKGTLIIHLGMSGQLRLVPSDAPVGKHDHLDLVLDNGQALRLRDPRRFGTVLWQVSGTLHPRLQDLGPEPLSPGFTASALSKSLIRTHRPLKAAIMDASIVVGVGNIYATEALFAAGLSPARPANSLSGTEIAELVRAIRAVLRRGIALGGSSMRDYVHADGSLGGFLGQAKVYGRAGSPCPVCGTALANILIAGRNGAWCPGCQH